MLFDLLIPRCILMPALVVCFTEKFVTPAPHLAHGTTSNLLYILLPCGLVVGILLAVLGVFILRHQRLQRSFLSYANSHYDTRSGTTTFNTGDDLGKNSSLLFYLFPDPEGLRGDIRQSVGRTVSHTYCQGCYSAPNDQNLLKLMWLIGHMV